VKQVAEQNKSKPAVHLRPTVFADAEAIKQLLERNRMGQLDTAMWSLRLVVHPFAKEFSDVPVGWVLKTDTGDVVGAVGNVHMLYEMKVLRHKGSIATEWAVDPSDRCKALHLNTSFSNQKGIDMRLSVSTGETVCRVLTGPRVSRIPPPTCNSPFGGPANYLSFGTAALGRTGIPRASMLAYPTMAVSPTQDILGRVDACPSWNLRADVKDRAIRGRRYAGSPLC
jgi:hypothetical protein